MIIISLVILISCLSLLVIRFVLGPTNLDRLMCMEAIMLIIMSLGALWGIAIGTIYFLDAILVLSIVGFITTIALAKFIEKGRLFDD
ncbi:MAG: monovalent cation/H+ antiporter complex subunit F [Sumerlaeia bacterium]